MTWVIGTPSMFGYGVAISDIRVSLPGGLTLDCLQKVYPVGKFIAAGFAGSVEFGFAAMYDLQRELTLSDPDKAWIPGMVAFKWFRRARKMFTKAPERVTCYRAEIILVGVSPSVDMGIVGWATPTVAILRSPDFSPEILKINTIASIGSGRDVEVYRKELLQLNNDRVLWQMEVNSPGGYGHVLMQMLSRTVEENPDRFVSPHVHGCIVRRGEIMIHKSDYTHFEADGTPREIRMPHVATSWSEFQRLCHDAGADATAATC